jgi:hypothetical protein
MWEEKGTDRIDALGHENWDKSDTSHNEVYLWYTNDNKKPGVVDTLNNMMCANPANTPHPQPTKAWNKNQGDNCWVGHGATDLENPPRSSCGNFETVAECEDKCEHTAGCTGVTVQYEGGKYACYRKSNINISGCDHGTNFDTYTYTQGGQFLQ